MSLVRVRFTPSNDLINYIKKVLNCTMLKIVKVTPVV